MRKQQTVKFPLSKSSEAKVRKFYKDTHPTIARNMNEEKLIRQLGFFTKDETYNYLVGIFNEPIIVKNQQITDTRTQAKINKVNEKREQEKIKTEKLNNPLSTFVIYLTIQIEYLKSYYETQENRRYKKGDIITIEDSTPPTTDFKNNINDIVGRYNSNDGYKEKTVLNHRVVFMNTEVIAQNQKPKIKQRMRRAFVMRNDWLKHSHGIAETAYKTTDNKCVYHQLVDYLLDPPSNIPSNFIYFTSSKKQHTSEEALYRFFCEKIQEKNLIEDYPDFTIDSGVSTELIGFLCESLKRNMYAYDEEQKIFHSIDKSNSKNYCPIVFYKFNGHFYLINDRSVISSTAETNKTIGTKIISITIEDKKVEENLPVYKIEKYDVSQSKNMIEGIYIVNQSNLDDEVIEFMKTFNETPLTKSKRSNTIQLKFQVGLNHYKSDRKYVCICIDATHADNFTHDQLKNVADNNNIKYINENIGTVILSVLEESNKPVRKTLNDKERQEFIQLHQNRCQVCKLSSKIYEIDHIEPLASGGDNSSENLQLLCPDCHKEKTTQEKLNATYKTKDNESSIFNSVVLENIVNNKSWNAYQFVEKVPNQINEYNEETEVEQPEQIIYKTVENQYIEPVKDNILDIIEERIMQEDNVKREIYKNFMENEEEKKKLKDEKKQKYNKKHTTPLPIIEAKPTPKDTINKFKNDIRKCRRNLTFYSKYEFPVYSIMDLPKPFTNKTQCGIYYIETINIYPLRGAGWYSQPIVEYCLSNKLITLNEIKLEFLPSYILPANHFQKHITTILSAFEAEPELLKQSVNAFVGLLGKTKRTATNIKYTLSSEEASLWWGEKDPKQEVFIENIDFKEENETFYKGIFSENVEVEGMKYAIYKQILEMEAVELHTLETIIIKKGGVILDRNTDAIRYARKQSINIDNYYWDDEKTVLKYQCEGAKPLQNEVLPRMCKKHTLDYNVFNLEWNIQEDYEGTAEEEAIRIIDCNKSIHINGRAGTGKTYIVNKIIEELKKRGKVYKGFSPTNKGARLINGNTIHSLYYKFKTDKKGLFKMIEKEKIEYIFIDEVSMMVKDFYQLFLLLKRAYKSMKFIIAGDFGQLPPVLDNWSGDYENSPAMHNLCDGNRINLMTCRRADSELYSLCKNVENMNISRFTPTEKTYLNLAYTHRTRKNINRECMERYLLEFGGNSVFIPRNRQNPKTQDVRLSKGMMIIAHKTDKQQDILNSQTFIITKITNETFTYKNNDNIYTLPISNFHKFFYLGFCITIHASQGETFTEKYTIYDWSVDCVCNKAKYVALSRGTNINNIQIQN